MNQCKELLSAIQFAAEKHQNQRRKGKDKFPYINHPIQVAHLLSSISEIDDTDILCAAILHDTVEDTDTTQEDIAEYFGDKIAGIVAEVSDDRSLPKPARKQAQIDHGPHLSFEASMVKLADKCCNIEDVITTPPENWDTQRRRAYLDWAKQVVNNIRHKDEKLLKKFKSLYEAGLTE